MPGTATEIMLQRACRACGAAAGRWCTTRRGQRATGLHSDRYFDAVRAGQLPVHAEVAR